MGQTLSEPVTTKETQTWDNVFCKAVACSMQGWRITMEDASTVVLSIESNPKQNFFGVYDGHGGVAASQFVKDMLHSNMIAQPSFRQGLYKDALVQAFLEMDQLMRLDSSGKYRTCGTTAVTVLTTNNNIYCANCGDSRAILSEGGIALPLSQDHKPNNPEESRRIRSAGGFVEFNRVNGTLALSRALGDFEFKSGLRRPKDQMVSAIPDVTTTALNENQEFIVLACDGVWDVVSNQECVDFIRTRLAQGQPPAKVCEALLTRCLAPNTGLGGNGCDNMSITLVALLQGNNWSKLVEKCGRPLR